MERSTDSTYSMVLNMFRIAIPAILTYFFALSLEVINLTYIGHLNAPHMVAGVGIANMYMNTFSLFIIMGLNSALTTFVP